MASFFSGKLRVCIAGRGALDYDARNFMPTLNWIGKEAVVNHHHQVPFRLLKDVPELACGDHGSGNLIVQGDNLVALKALLPYHARQVKCI